MQHSDRFDLYLFVFVNPLRHRRNVTSTFWQSFFIEMHCVNCNNIHTSVNEVHILKVGNNGDFSKIKLANKHPKICILFARLYSNCFRRSKLSTSCQQASFNNFVVVFSCPDPPARTSYFTGFCCH